MSPTPVPKVCIALRESSPASLEEVLAKSSGKSEYVELRLDFLSLTDLTVANLRKWKRLAGVPTIATFRRKPNGGEFSGTEAEQLSVVKAALEAEMPFVDLEIETIESHLAGTLDSLKGYATRLIASYHNFEGTPGNLDEIYQRLAGANPDIVKIATQARTFSDNLRLLNVIGLARQQHQPIIGVAMGELGMYTRILAPSRGSMLTYASAEGGRETAPGQMTAEELAQVYGIENIDSETRLHGVIGYPLGHSLSPHIHNAAFRHLNLNRRLLPFPIEDLADFALHLKQFSGLCVTIPHKLNILKYADEIDETVEAIGAANTLVIRQDRVRAYNTDVDGIRHALREPLQRGVGKAVLLGAGGAARAAAVVLRQSGCSVTVLARNPGKAQRFADEFGFSWDSLERSPRYEGDLLINATSVGMSPALEQSPLPASALHYRYVFDMVYNPLETRLLKEARGKAVAISGLDMFVAQAARQFELWTDREAPRELMRNVVLKKLGAA